MEMIEERTWRCFHCDEVFTDKSCAKAHFGFDEVMSQPACIIKAGAEGSLVKALRNSERDCDELRHLLHDESCEAYRLYAAQISRHHEQLQVAEEAGYERGLVDARTPEPRPANGEMIEKVARAIASARSWQPKPLTVGDWDDRSTNERKPFLALARAAIAAYNPNERLRGALEKIANGPPVDFDDVFTPHRLLDVIEMAHAALSHKD